MKMTLKLAVLSILASFLVFGLAAQAEYPEKPVTFIVPWPPGDLEDITTRMIAEEFQKEYGVAAAVVNKPGGGGGPFPGRPACRCTRADNLPRCCARLQQAEKPRHSWARWLCQSTRRPRRRTHRGKSPHRPCKVAHPRRLCMCRRRTGTRLHSAMSTRSPLLPKPPPPERGIRSSWQIGMRSPSPDVRKRPASQPQHRCRRRRCKRPGG